MSWLKSRDWSSGIEYSNLFHSGLRAISLRPRARRNSSILSSSPEKPSRRSSVISFSSRFLKRSDSSVKSSPCNTPEVISHAPRSEKALRPRPSSMFIRGTKDLAEQLWVAGGNVFSSYDVKNYVPRNSPPNLESIDPFSSSPGSRSFFVSLSDSTSSPKGESFLSLSSTSPAPDGLYHPLPLRERPISIQTMPLPSRRSSIQYRPVDTWERFDAAWMLEESSPSLDPQEDEGGIEVLNLNGDDDWRQFHVDWLQNGPGFQISRDV
ncbi:hypothetical protein SERLA73DRAFT_182383 [Serpula lacrymans var. lacrymans S7.3]|uniref:Uncharacterized protein n=2 Tax=Serpula lacrymans var. lacrymans TaxID=341189 RepID=F8PX33_SERL3|nr:uncharacterized protein SERLADRAFT_449690 [Serpula lacrymans var. lacrymans S7.9]EGN99412.1 hypothetical protein SERLA73DRAFT_182383 [Serpula lacrymans var. lacrymans S7.3]EGO24975.1 hypothetical protein SERLADRAFT_449690 [Serpula lacrymans var. lacrymans S7.9]